MILLRNTTKEIKLCFGIQTKDHLLKRTHENDHAKYLLLANQNAIRKTRQITTLKSSPKELSYVAQMKLVLRSLVTSLVQKRGAGSTSIVQGRVPIVFRNLLCVGTLRGKIPISLVRVRYQVKQSHKKGLKIFISRMRLGKLVKPQY